MNDPQPSEPSPARGRARLAFLVAGAAVGVLFAALYGSYVSWELGFPARSFSATVVLCAYFAAPAVACGLLYGGIKALVAPPPPGAPDPLGHALRETFRGAVLASFVAVLGFDVVWRLSRDEAIALAPRALLALVFLTVSYALWRVLFVQAADGRAMLRRGAATSVAVVAATTLSGLLSGGGEAKEPLVAAREAAAVPPSPSLSPAAPSGLRLLVLAVDGGDLDEVQLAVRAGAAPTLGRLLAEGAAIKVNSSMEGFGDGSAILWTCMVTGVGPARHGVVDLLNGDVAGLPDFPVERLMDHPSHGPALVGGLTLLGTKLARASLPPSTRRKVPAIWQMVSDQGGSVRVLCMPATWPAEAVRGELLSDRGRRSAFEIFTPYDPDLPGVGYPPDLLGRLVGAAGDPAVVAWPELEGLADWTDFDRSELAQWTSAVGQWEAQRWLSVAVSGDLWTLRSLEHLLKERGPRDLTMCALYLVDQAAHNYWDASHPEGAPRPPSAERVQRYGRITRETWRLVDRWLEGLLKLVDDKTVVVLVSDHGMKATRYMEFTGHHSDDAMLLAWRPGVVRKAGVIEGVPATLLDVTPTLLSLLGMKAPPGIEGRVLTELLEPR